MELTLTEFMDFYHDSIPLRVRVWNIDTWEIDKEGFVVDGKVVDSNGAVLFDSLSALDSYYVSTVSGHDLPTANLYPHWNP